MLDEVAADAGGDDQSGDGVGVRQDDGEFVAAQPRRDVGAAQALLNRDGDAAQRLVARMMAPAVVHQLQPIDVDEQKRERDGIAAAARDLSRHGRVEVVAIEQAGERIGD